MVSTQCFNRAQSVYTNLKTGQTSAERPEADPCFVETELFLNFSPEETETLSKVRFGVSRMRCKRR